MKRTYIRWRWGIAVTLLVLNLVIGLWPMYGPSSAEEPKRFVYKVVEVPGDTHALQRTLNEYGGAGWQLVAVAIGEIQVPRLIFQK